MLRIEVGADPMDGDRMSPLTGVDGRVAADLTTRSAPTESDHARGRDQGQDLLMVEDERGSRTAREMWPVIAEGRRSVPFPPEAERGDTAPASLAAGDR
ncbi:hypothetical protein ABZ851_12860 [Streptomyces sp. NPDC047049]|uniref:hypothetical protein n=1 Tax=Streptomyces sp. NPDC047049 TaxID=3156688 RepID=UPI0033D23DE8